MKQTIISRFLTASSHRSILVATLCMVIPICSVITAAAADQRRGGERTEQRRDNNGRRSNEGNRDKDRRDNRGQQRKRNDNASAVKHDTHKQHQSTGTRPGNNTKPVNNEKPSTRPGGSLNNNGYRPGAAGNNNHNKPGNNTKPGNNVKPGPGNNNKPGNHVKPGNVGNPRPNNNHGPSHNWKPGHPNQVRPGAPIHRPVVAPPPMRPMRPAHFHGYHRPVPPPSWRPGPRPLFSTVLGLAFGSAISAGIDALITAGYTVDGYYDNNVYVNDVVQLNMRWPFGVLQYNNAGYLVGSEFAYSSDWRDLNRYNMAFSRLSSLYGPPIQSSSQGGNLSSTWWGPGGQYVTLRFDYRAPMQGGKRFYTTLSFGM